MFRMRTLITNELSHQKIVLVYPLFIHNKCRLLSHLPMYFLKKNILKTILANSRLHLWSGFIVIGFIMKVVRPSAFEHLQHVISRQKLQIYEGCPS